MLCGVQALTLAFSSGELRPTSLLRRMAVPTLDTANTSEASGTAALG